MPRARCPESVKAEEMYQSGMALADIAKKIGRTERTIRRWKHNQGWKKTERPEKGKTEGYDFLSKYLPEETVSIIQEMPTDPLDVLWNQIQLSYAAIVRAQKIMYVRDQQDKTIEKMEEKDGGMAGEKWEVQQAWDKQAKFLSAQAKVMTSLRGDIRQYEELLHKRWDLATKEQKARIEQLKANTERIQRDSRPDEDEGVEIYNDAPEKMCEDIGNHHSEVSSDI